MPFKTPHQDAYNRAQQRECARMAKDPCVVVPANTPYHFDVERTRAFAAGWIAGHRYALKNRRK